MNITPSPPTLLDSDQVYIVCGASVVSSCTYGTMRLKAYHVQYWLGQVAVQLCQAI